jgi:hypothetical protein
MKFQIPVVVGEKVNVGDVSYELVESGQEPDETGRGRIAVFKDTNGKRYMPNLEQTEMLSLPEGC